ncbi:unnamed protein product [Caenorhabditis nigoni]
MNISIHDVTVHNDQGIEGLLNVNPTSPYYRFSFQSRLKCYKVEEIDENFDEKLNLGFPNRDSSIIHHHDLPIIRHTSQDSPNKSPHFYR